MQDQEHTILSHPEEYQEPDACMLLCAEHRPYFGTRAIEAVLKRQMTKEEVEAMTYNPGGRLQLGETTKIKHK
eukprot:scaffold12922_cov32-Tisochrysis_lutea.AAC.3